MSNLHASYLKEMGITEWVTREPGPSVSPSPAIKPTEDNVISQTAESSVRAHWWFFGAKPQGEAQFLFQNIIRVLGLSSQEWSWKLLSDDLSKFTMPEDGAPVVALAFGSPAVQKATGERDPLPQLRETILALNTGNDDEIPVLASQDLAQVVGNPKEKALLWQDLLLAKSVLQNT
ncbi:DNA polymerase III subunit psi [Polynucleobacter sp. MWH-UH25E]|uniref:DNA polymerase III subunit psi n=1 Tax=Polynucleobacter sp. MWH-UH25E TaxID=1855616 RepID=UPI001BFDBE86|nr:DNA polymerase III subunit psi [Polynucleobacter sp. MWH-UH25E]QWD61639.1 DNA polymerase III subunit psi [Polynucleobacter sp. MWH-UH25E]